MALCWNEALSKSSIPERLKVIAFLVQLRSHFPTWQGNHFMNDSYDISHIMLRILVLSWDVVIETLLETDYIQNNGDDEAAAAAAHLVSNYRLLCRNTLTDDSI